MCTIFFCLNYLWLQKKFKFRKRKFMPRRRKYGYMLLFFGPQKPYMPYMYYNH